MFEPNSIVIRAASVRTVPSQTPRRRALATLALLGLGALAPACASGPPPAAFENRVFYNYDDFVASGGGSVERPYPPLDQKERAGLPEYVGVSILGGSVHLSRPKSWKIRRISLTPERRFVEYVSPNAYLFSIYERNDSTADLWSEVLERYEEDVKAAGAEIVGGRVPVATGNAQGREYVVKRSVKGQKGPYSNTSHEVVLRSEHRIDVVEIVHQGDTPAAVGQEMLRVMETLELH